MSLESQRESSSFRSLCVNLLDCLEKADWPPRYRNVFGQWASIARVALAETADGPAVLASREPAAVARQPSDEELLGLHCLTTKQLRASGKGECNHLTAFARAVLARWGRPTPPAPPAEGEIAELIAQLRSRHYGPAALDRAAELLERLAAPVPEGREPPAVAERPSGEELGLIYHDCCRGCEFMDQVGFEDAARAVLARWGRPAQPAPPAEGEVAELVAKLRRLAPQNPLGSADPTITRAAELLERHAAPVPVPVAERLPEPNTKVLAHYFNDHGKGRTICAIWVPAGSRECTGDDSISEPVEGCWPEGWYELIENWNWEDYGWIAVNEGEVAYWQPLPKWPANTLPLPAPQGGEVEP